MDVSLPLFLFFLSCFLSLFRLGSFLNLLTDALVVAADFFPGQPLVKVRTSYSVFALCFVVALSLSLTGGACRTHVVSARVFQVG